MLTIINSRGMRVSGSQYFPTLGTNDHHVKLEVAGRAQACGLAMTAETFNKLQLRDDMCVTYPSGNIYLLTDLDLKSKAHATWRLVFKGRRLLTQLEFEVMKATCS